MKLESKSFDSALSLKNTMRQSVWTHISKKTVFRCFRSEVTCCNASERLEREKREFASGSEFHILEASHFCTTPPNVWHAPTWFILESNK